MFPGILRLRLGRRGRGNGGETRWGGHENYTTYKLTLRGEERKKKRKRFWEFALDESSSSRGFRGSALIAVFFRTSQPSASLHIALVHHHGFSIAKFHFEFRNLQILYGK